MVYFNQYIYSVGYGQVPGKSLDFIIMKVPSATGSYSNTTSWNFGGTFKEIASTMDIDPSGFMYVTGTSDSDGMTTGFNDIFTFKFNPNTGTGVWAVYLGSSASDTENSYDIVVSPDMQSVYVVGVEDFTGISFGQTDILMI